MEVVVRFAAAARAFGGGEHVQPVSRISPADDHEFGGTGGDLG